jgi:uncharacterized repeat protein (TIGR01451 family)
MKWFKAVPLAVAALLAAACADTTPTALRPTEVSGPQFFGGQSSDNLTGAIFTSVAGCGKTNVNIYDTKPDVYLNGGPVPGGNGQLPDGSYYVQITDPSGATVLGTSVGATNDTPFVVEGGLGNCIQLSDVLVRGSDPMLAGYDDTPNNGGEYKVWISMTPDFSDRWKTDNFKVRAKETNCPAGGCLNEIPDITVEKSAGSSTVTIGQPVSFTITVTSVGTATANNVTLTDALPSAGGLSWSVSTPPAGGSPTCSITAGVLSCTAVNLAATSSFSVTVSATTGGACGTINNTASASFDVPVDGGGSITQTSSSNQASISITGCPQLRVRKFYDADGNGQMGAGENFVSNWQMGVAGPNSYSFSGPTPVNLSELGLGTYTATESSSLVGTWTQSAAFWYETANQATTQASGSVVSLAANDDKTIVFGNYCTNPAAGWTLGFWSNNNGQARLATWTDWATMLVGTTAGSRSLTIGSTTLNYQLWVASASKNGTVSTTQFLLSTTTGTPSTSKKAATGSYLQFQNWLLGAQASANGSALYMLSAQFAAAVLNAQVGGTSTKLGLTDVLPGTGKTVGTILTEAASLLNAGLSADRAQLTLYIGYLNQINNKAGVIPSVPCAFQF